MKKLLVLAAVLAAGVASAELQWETSVNVPADFVPLSDNLMLGTTKNALTDGKLPDEFRENINQCWVTSGQVFTCTSEMPKDIKQIRIFSEWDHAYDGFAVDAISVRYAGSDEYVVLDGSACPYANYDKGKGHMAQLSNDNGGFIALGVTGVKITMGSGDSFTKYVKSLFGEIEVQGFDAVPESVSVAFTEPGESLSATVSAAMGAYPAEVWLCTGDADAGTDFEAWASKKKIGSLDSASDVIAYGPDTDYGSKYQSCRVCVYSDYSKRFVWSEVRTVSYPPAASVTGITADEVSATLSLLMPQAGFGASSADVTFAYARHGETLPAKTVAVSGLLPDVTFPLVIDGLDPNKKYDYEIELTNDKGASTTLAGSFSTVIRSDVVSANAWTVTAYKPENFVPLSDNLMLGTTGNGLTDGKMSAAHNLNVDQVWWNVGVSRTCTSETPRDIKRIRVYSQWDSGYDGFGMSPIAVRYAGTDEFVELDGSSLPFTDLNTGIGQCAEFADANGGFIARNVTGVRVTLGAGNLNNQSLFSELEVQGFGLADESIAASYVEADGSLSARVTAETSEPPAKIYFVSGETDGGTDFAAWDKVRQIGTLEGTSGEFDFGPDATFGTDYQYCRFCYYSTYYGCYVWSEGYKVSAEPVADVTVAAVDETSASLVVDVKQLGYGASSVDISLAYAPHGEQLPAKTPVASDVTTVGAVPVAIADLTDGVVYDYEFLIVNDKSEETVISGTFTTVPNPGDPDVSAVTYTWKTGLAAGRWNSTASWDASVSPCYGIPSNSTYAAVVFPANSAETVTLSGTYPVKSMSMPSGVSVTLQGDGQVESASSFNLYGTLNLIGSAPLKVNGSIRPQAAARVYMNGLTKFPNTSYMYVQGNTAIVLENCNITKDYAFARSGGDAILAFTNTTFKSKSTNHYGPNATTILSGSTVTLELFGAASGGTFILDDSVIDLSGNLNGNIKSIALSGANTVFGLSGSNFRFVDGSVSLDCPEGGFANGAPITAKNAALTNLTFSIKGAVRASGSVRLPVLTASESLSVDLESLTLNIEDGDFKVRNFYLSPDGKTLWARASNPGLMLLIR